MIFNMSGSGGSGGFELSIVGGTTRPTKASHNMVWVDTDVEITEYVLSAIEPQNPVSGMVWVRIGNSGSTKVVSTIGDDWITVYPLSAKQYISGAWVDKTARSYQNGTWVDWILNLYNNGDECISVTGGWSTNGVKITTQDALAPAAMNSDHMLIGQTTAASKGTYCVMSTVEKINFKPNTKTLCVDYTTLKTSGGNVSNIYIQQDKTIGSNNYIAMTQLTAAEGERATLEVDVSSVNGEYFVIFASWYDSKAIRAAKIHRVWLA